MIIIYFMNTSTEYSNALENGLIGFVLVLTPSKS